MLHGIGLCIAVPNAECRLNSLQVEWAHVILGVAGYPHGNWTSLVSACGWTMRLGTAMFCEAIMLEARVLCMPRDSASRRVLVAARRECCKLTSWARHVSQCRVKLGGIPDISEWVGEVPDWSSSYSNRCESKSYLQQYRSQVVIPALREYDEQAFLQSSREAEWPFGDYTDAFCETSVEIMNVPWSPDQWCSFEIWKLVQSTGRWPLPLLGIDLFPAALY